MKTVNSAPRKRDAITLIEPLDFARGRLPLMRRRKRGAFTLIELLVVIAIIAILASLLVPALKRAQEKARRAYCSSSLHQVGVGVYSYAADHEGTVPLPHWDPSKSSANPWTTYEVFRVSPGSHSITEGPYNLGILFSGDIISNPQIFYCPSGTRYAETYTYEYYSRNGPWPSTPNGSGDDNVRVSYNYYPVSLSRSERARGSKNGLSLPAYTLDDLDVRKAMGTDLLHRLSVLPHQDEGFAGLNAMFGDGHVRFQSQRDLPQAFDQKYWGVGDAGTPLGNKRSEWRIVMSMWQP